MEPYKRNKKPVRKFSESELILIQQMYEMEIPEEHIATMVGVCRDWYNELLKKPGSDALRCAKKAGKAAVILAAHRSMWDKIKTGDWPATKFWLERKGGYASQNKIELSGPEGGPIESSQLSREELKAKVMALRAANDLTDDE